MVLYTHLLITKTFLFIYLAKFYHSSIALILPVIFIPFCYFLGITDFTENH